MWAALGTNTDRYRLPKLIAEKLPPNPGQTSAGFSQISHLHPSTSCAGRRTDPGFRVHAHTSAYQRLEVCVCVELRCTRLRGCGPSFAERRRPFHEDKTPTTLQGHNRPVQRSKLSHRCKRLFDVPFVHTPNNRRIPEPMFPSLCNHNQKTETRPTKHMLMAKGRQRPDTPWRRHISNNLGSAFWKGQQGRRPLAFWDHGFWICSLSVDGRLCPLVNAPSRPCGWIVMLRS